MCGAGILRELAEIAQRAGPSMESKMYGIRKDNEGFQVCVMRGDGVSWVEVRRE